MAMGTLRRVVFWLTLAGGTVYGLGDCSLRSIGAGLLSEFLTSGASGTVGSSVTSGLDSLLSQFLGSGSA